MVTLPDFRHKLSFDPGLSQIPKTSGFSHYNTETCFVLILQNLTDAKTFLLKLLLLKDVSKANWMHQFTDNS